MFGGGVPYTGKITADRALEGEVGTGRQQPSIPKPLLPPTKFTEADISTKNKSTVTRHYNKT